LYGKRDGYWTGPVWININYLFLSSLKINYMHSTSPYADVATRAYNRVRDSLVRYVMLLLLMMMMMMLLLMMMMMLLLLLSCVVCFVYV